MVQGRAQTCRSLRDHADEDSDSGVESTGEMNPTRRGFTPMTAPGATTIRTPEREALLVEDHPLVVDTVANCWGKWTSTAIGLRNAGVSRDFSDSFQGRLRTKMQTLTKGELDTSVVAVREFRTLLTVAILLFGLSLLVTPVYCGAEAAERLGRRRACQN